KLDHIIILIPYSLLQSLPNSITSLFTISPGGRHADNKTENKLVIFSDGVYFEFISFIDDSADLKSGHWWGALPNGIIDFALTSQEVGDVEVVRLTLNGLGSESEQGEEPANLGITYAEPRAGGRTTGGHEIKWHVTFPTSTHPSDSVKRGSVPFWCHDVTQRTWRVTSDSAEATTHPSGALGVKSITVGVPSAKFTQYCKVYGGIT
ncbi:hypothetical protein NA57DRAFT_15763, partial [Rhizodiscina lignyota]